MKKIYFCIPGMQSSEIFQEFLADNQFVDASFNRGLHRPSPEELKEIAKSYDIIVGGVKERYFGDVLDLNSKVQLICTLSSGTDHIDLELVDSLGIKVVNTPGANSDSVAEYCVGAALSLAKHIHGAGSLSSADTLAESGQATPTDLKGKASLIIGAGHIAQKLSSLLTTFGCTQYVWTLNPQNHQSTFGDQVTIGGDLKHCLPTADYIFVCIPLSERTRGILSEAEARRVKQGFKLISISRAEVIDDTFLLSVTEGRKTSGVALDIASPSQYGILSNLQNSIVTPHIAGNTVEADKNMDSMVVRGIQEFLEA